MARVLATPGVYIEEKNAFSSSVVAVATAVPAFVGYTQRALRGTKSLVDKPTKIKSFPEFVSFYGGAPKVTYTIEPNEEVRYDLKADPNTEFFLYNSVKMFYANGGGDCYVVSVGDYSNGVKPAALNNLETGSGLQSLLLQTEPTMVVIPDAVLLEEADCYALQQAMVGHCGTEMRDRIALLDVHGGYKSRTLDEEDVVNRFREGIGTRTLEFAASYYPWLNCNVVDAESIDYSNVSNSDVLIELLTGEIDAMLEAGAVKEKRAELVKVEIGKIASEDSNRLAVHETLLAVSPLYKDIMKDVRLEMNILPPSGIMAGVYSLVDSTVGVHKAPANVSLVSVIAPAVDISSDDQEDLNLPLTGKAVNAIRSFVGQGVLVWGARTMNGNSQDWRYINVRRTMNMIEESIKIAAGKYVFEPNDQSTWNNVKAMIDNFLNIQWKAGALVGPTAAQAFETSIGLGKTMTPIDILDGVMRVSVKVAISRPAEFIVITFQQKMQEA